MTAHRRAVSSIIEHPGITIPQIMDQVNCQKSVAHAVKTVIDTYKELSVSNQSVVGIIGDQHEPACHKGYFQFVCKTFADYGVNRVAHAGDLIDHHFISRFANEPDALNSEQEMDLAINNLKKWTKQFPEVSVCLGNHDTIPTRQAKTLGISPRFLRNLNDIYELPKTWVIRDHHEIDNVWYEHGDGSTGMYGAINTAMKYRTNYVQGHIHSFGGCLHRAGIKDSIWGLNVGCGLDSAAYAARYAKPFKYKPTLGCGIVFGGTHGMFVPMAA